MRLAKLTVSGFKSFADRTEFGFDDAITGIVGPNGCGKSNIVDAIKWVLGERSSKSLRGKEMVDVIFAGSAARKPSGMASVTLTFDNPVLDPTVEAAPLDLDLAERCADGDELDAEEDDAEEPRRDGRRRRGLPIEADAVSVERRLYRDGTSHYLINDKRVRLRDIRDLFLDTGVGADAYSIIEQGKVDAMLLASPQERRTIFEEAAGIARYKVRRLEAARKLERTEANLAIVREQLANTERRLRIVRGQATKARRYKALDAEHSALRLAIAFDQYADLCARLEGLTSRLADLDGVRRAAAESLDAAEGGQHRAEADRAACLDALRAVCDRRTQLEHVSAQAAQRREMTEGAIVELRAQSTREQARWADVQRQAGALASDHADRASEVAAMSERLGEVERLLGSLSAERVAVLDEQAAVRAALDEARSSAARVDREAASLVGSMEADEKRRGALEAELASLEDRAASIERERAETEAAVEALRVAAESHRAESAEAERGVGEHEARAASLSRSLRDASSRVGELEQQFLRLDGRRATLREMVDAHEGVGEVVREVLAEARAGTGFRGVRGLLAELIETDERSAVAVEAALGPDLQALVIDSLEALPSRDELARLRGRVTLVPIAAGNEPEAENDDASDGLAAMASLVRPAIGGTEGEAIARMLGRLLARTGMVESLEDAVRLAPTRPGWRLVTRGGQVLEADGRVHAGPRAGESGAGLLQRRAELTTLDAQLEGLGGDLASARSALEELDARVAQHSEARSTLAARVARAQRALIADQVRLDQAGGELERAHRAARELDERREQLRESLARVDADRAALTERTRKLRALHEELAARAEDLERRDADVDARAESIAERLTASRIEAGRVGEQLQAARRDVHRIELSMEETARASRDLALELDRTRDRLCEHERALEEASAQIESAATDLATIGEDVERARLAIADADAAVAQAADRLRGARDRAGQLDRDWHSLEVSRREVEVKRETLEDRASSELGVDLAAELPDYRAMMAGGDVARIDIESAAAEADALRAQMRDLGTVNLDAIEEEGQLEARNESLIAQVADIDRAAAQLARMIERLNEASVRRFTEAFASIQEHFAGPQGMFRKLFGGGRAEIRLMPLVREVDGERVVTDEIHPLESGIEVIAKPPGKEPRTISQLSGGERTLTAVAILLAIFRSKPSCFCVLDEVDAALDDANVDRFRGMVREFARDSHFLVITHNKRTMQECDRLYGVTMQERGVSTRVSVRLEEVDRRGAAGPDGQARAEPKPLRGAIASMRADARAARA